MSSSVANRPGADSAPVQSQKNIGHSPKLGHHLEIDSALQLRPSAAKTRERFARIQAAVHPRVAPKPTPTPRPSQNGELKLLLLRAMNNPQLMQNPSFQMRMSRLSPSQQRIANQILGPDTDAPLMPGMTPAQSRTAQMLRNPSMRAMAQANGAMQLTATASVTGQPLPKPSPSRALAPTMDRHRDLSASRASAEPSAKSEPSHSHK